MYTHKSCVYSAMNSHKANTPVCCHPDQETEYYKHLQKSLPSPVSPLLFPPQRLMPSEILEQCICLYGFGLYRTGITRHASPFVSGFFDSMLRS